MYILSFSLLLSVITQLALCFPLLEPRQGDLDIFGPQLLGPNATCIDSAFSFKGSVFGSLCASFEGTVASSVDLNTCIGNIGGTLTYMEK
jgi:hypothetical protein